jgi:hypothetical protein
MPQRANTRDSDDSVSFSHLIRGGLAIVLTVSLPVVLIVGPSSDSALVQTYIDALAAVVAFYFGASSTPD